MRAVHIGIRHDDDLVIAQLCDVKVIAVSFGKSTAERVDHRFDLRIRKHLVDTGLLYIKDLTTDRHDRLKHTVSRHFCGAAGGISLDDKNFTFCGISGLTVGKLSIGVKRKLLFGQKIGLCLLLRLTDLCRLFRTGNDRF